MGCELAFGWAAPCAAPAGTLHDLAQVESALRMVVIRLPWLACQVYPWLADGVSGHDFQSLESLMNLARINESFAMEVASYPWFIDGVDYRWAPDSEPGVLRELTTIAEQYPDLLNDVRGLTWITENG